MLAFYFFSYSLPATCQSTDYTPQDTIQINEWLAKSKELINSNPESALHYSKQAKELAIQKGFQKGEAIALKNIGLVYLNQGKFLEAIHAWTQSKEIFQTTNDLIGVSNILNNIGVIYSIQGDYQNALKSYLESLKFAEQTHDKTRILYAMNNIGGTYSLKRETYDKALYYYLKALPLAEEVRDTNSIGTTAVNIGEVYANQGNSAKALFYYDKSLKIYKASKNNENIPYAYNAIAKEYKKQGKFNLALDFHTQALRTAQKAENQLYVVQSLLGLANMYTANKQPATALGYFKQAETTGRNINARDELKDIYNGLAATYATTKRYDEAFRYQSLYTDIKDTLYNIETDKKLASMQFDFDLQKKQGEINLLTKDKILQESEIRRQKLFKNAFTIGLILVFIIAFIIFRNYKAKVRINKILDKQKAEIETLLLNILPAEVAKELQTHGHATPRNYETVSVLFTDFKGFTTLADKMTPQELVQELNACFMSFDEIIERNQLEKIKTIGDSYMCAGGIPSPHPEHAYNIVKASLEMQQYISLRNQGRLALNLEPWDIRIGIHAGPIVAGVVGKKKYAYDIWGSTVNIASRMESNGAPGQVNVSESFYKLIKDRFECTHRGKIYAKNVGEIDMYFVNQQPVLTPAESPNKVTLLQ